MGLFSMIFDGLFKSAASSKPFSTYYSASMGKSDQGIALARFNSIIDAHSSVEEIVDDWELDSEHCPYPSLDGYPNCYMQAYEEALEVAIAEAEALAAMGVMVDPEDLINWDQVYEDAYDYACDLAQAWLDGVEWIPAEVLDWAWYDISDHNG